MIKEYRYLRKIKEEISNLINYKQKKKMKSLKFAFRILMDHQKFFLLILLLMNKTKNLQKIKI